MQLHAYRLTDALTLLSSLELADQKLAVKTLEELAQPLISGTWWADDGIWWNVDDLSMDTVTNMAHAAYWLAVLTSSGLLDDVVDQDYDRANELLHSAASRGLADAHQALAYRYETGYKLQANCEVAYSHLKVM
jgi:TPR repeat protein